MPLNGLGMAKHGHLKPFKPYSKPFKGMLKAFQTQSEPKEGGARSQKLKLGAGELYLYTPLTYHTQKLALQNGPLTPRKGAVWANIGKTSPKWLKMAWRCSIN